MIDQGYKKLEIYRLAHELAVTVHAMSMTLPKHEMYEQGSQIRRSSKSVAAQIVEGFCLRRHKNEFLLYLHRAYASAEESVEHLDLLFETGSLTDRKVFDDLRGRYESLCAMMFKFIQTVSSDHEVPYSVREDEGLYRA
jgi:four helix bundle protein